MKKILFFNLLILLGFSVIGQQLRRFDFTEKTNNTKSYYKIISKENLEVAVTYKNDNFDSYKGDVYLPDTVRWRGKTYKVVAIADSAFYSSKRLGNVYLSKSIKTIGEGAFELSSITNLFNTEYLYSIKAGALSNCKNLYSFIIGNKTKEIGDYAFDNSGITNLTIACDSIINDKALNNMSSLKEVTLLDADCKYINSNTFTGTNNIQTLNYNANNFSSISPFENMQSLSKVTIGDKVSSICENFIRGCKNITSIQIPNSVTSISAYAFAETNIKEIKIPSSIKEMGIAVFKDNKALQTVILPDNLGVIVENTFEGCENLNTINIPSSLFEISDLAFHNCTSLSEITLPESIETIGKESFANCISLQNIFFLGSNPPEIENEAVFPQNVEMNIDCNYILNYKNTERWKDLSYPCSLD